MSANGHILSSANKRKSPPRTVSDDDNNENHDIESMQAIGEQTQDQSLEMGGVSAAPTAVAMTDNSHPMTAAHANQPSHVLTAGPVVHTANHLLFSSMQDHKLGLTQVWSDWTTRNIKIYKNGYLSYAQKRLKADQFPPWKQFFHLKDLDVKLMGDIQIDNEDEEETESVQGLVIKCRTFDGLESYFRVVMSLSELSPFLTALHDVTGDESFLKLQQESLHADSTHGNKESGKGVSGNALAKSTQAVSRIIRRKMGIRPRRGKSVMRMATAQAMDKYDRRTKNEHIVGKRGAFKYLPVMGNNDLIHGSVWFTVGSVGIIFTSLFVVVNKYFQMLSDDDSTLTQADYAASWILMAISGVFSTLGSAAFVRAFNEDPPMRPLFKWYHLQNDELLASWLFVGAVAPFIPYVLIFLSEAESNSMALLYLVALAFCFIALFGTLLFVRSCYPSDQQYTSLLPRIMKYVFCCCSQETRDHYFVNDWLGGSWLFYWGTFFTTFCTVILFIAAIVELNSITVFVYGTSLAESIAFLIGSAYFVAGSYPEPESNRATDSSSKSSASATSGKNVLNDAIDEADEDDGERFDEVAAP